MVDNTASLHWFRNDCVVESNWNIPLTHLWIEWRCPSPPPPPALPLFPLQPSCRIQKGELEYFMDCINCMTIKFNPTLSNTTTLKFLMEWKVCCLPGHTLIKPQWETIQVHTYAANYQAQKLHFCTKDSLVTCTKDYGNVCMNSWCVTNRNSVPCSF